MTSSPTESPFSQLGYLLKTLQHQVRTRMDDALAHLGLTAPQYAAMTTIEQTPGASNADLARAAFVAPPTMIRILDLLERDGRVVRHPHPRHGRIVQVELTLDGRRCLEKAHRLIAPIEATLHAGLSAPAEQAVRRWLTNANQRLQDNSGMDESRAARERRSGMSARDRS
jgi:DNA-binding MarR family transcriptional regulator